MSLWWARRDQLDSTQVSLIEDLPLRGRYLVLGPPGSGKTNVLLRRAQFVRMQGLPNSLVLTFTRPLTEFIKTGCVNAAGNELFPRALVTTFESWIRSLYADHEAELPAQPSDDGDLANWKRALAVGANGFLGMGRMPRYDTLFVDEAQDLLPEEVELIAQWGESLMFVGDDRQRIYDHGSGLSAVRRHVSTADERTLPFHYRLAPELCGMADRILNSSGSGSLASTEQYSGPRPGSVKAWGPMSRDDQFVALAEKLGAQMRVYADLIRQGDKLGVVAARTADRDAIVEYLDAIPEFSGKVKAIRSRSGDRSDTYDPVIDDETAICVMTVKACKGLEFRALHWPLCEELNRYHTLEHYYTVVTRAKTSLDLYFTRQLPQDLARAYAPGGGSIW